MIYLVVALIAADLVGTLLALMYLHTLHSKIDILLEYAEEDEPWNRQGINATDFQGVAMDPTNRAQ